MLKLSSKSYVTVNGAAMAPQAARARGAICPLKSTRTIDGISRMVTKGNTELSANPQVNSRKMPHHSTKDRRAAHRVRPTHTGGPADDDATSRSHPRGEKGVRQVPEVLQGMRVLILKNASREQLPPS